MSQKTIGLDVSRETIERLELYLELLRKWNPAINLVSKSSIDDAWDRHFMDSVQVYGHAPKGWLTWADFGSGGGFPGAVIAILAMELNPEGRITLVESDQRKTAFLRTVFRETGVTGDVIAGRVEAIPDLNSDIISARALADLSSLFELSLPHTHGESTLLLSKGSAWQKELTQAEESWSFSCTTHKSITDPNAIILKIESLNRV
ncbi:MAG: 16S rRNA (guanine(527)-N(7))-methyltransferase RsmG [Paracoccaceae bacterium]|jgi:16S rRNA (guanine527-N7)-methyltransferase|nr:16S rRNA (guanine(527)-N(7))-methyltransferase RsmG [Paracoccaceae bacterium]